ncbi:MAG TPA: hypothetical protein VJQ77_00280 [Novosphingobium sp.]|nr:hypothetical protein [Novosphingobium sp.]
MTLAGCTAGRLSQLERTLAGGDSATAALGNWCAARGLADPPRIVARRVRGEDAPLPSDARALLDIRPGTAPDYRHVRLNCGNVTLSEAHNWFVTSRLTPEMNATLAATDKPFGTVIAPLHFTRERLATSRTRAEGCPPGTVLSHRAVLRLPDGRPISLVVECYQQGALR